MSQYPDPESSHFAPIYPAAPSSQSQSQSHLLGNGHQQQMHYSSQLNPNIYPKMESLSDVLQQQAHQASHALTDQRNIPQGAADAHNSKPNRLRKACDSCSIRKVKCDESGPPCKACAALEIPCTFDRPSRRRGPPNRHAEAIKKRRLEGGGSEHISGTSTPSSPTNAAHALAQLSSHPPHLSAESICSLPTVHALIDDFFTYIHPLCPFPHEPTFREAWGRREDYTNPNFLALLASMIAVLVASFPRKPRLHLKTQTKDHFPTHLAFVDKCREICAQARGPGYLDRPQLSVYDACTSYFLALTGAYTFQWRACRLYFGECLTILRSLGLHKAKGPEQTELGTLPGALGANGLSPEGPRDESVDKITEQMGRRVFWTMFVGVRTMQQFGASFGELTILPQTPSELLPPLPAEVDDQYIFSAYISPQPEGVPSLMTGFAANVRVYNSYSTLSTMEMAFGIGEVFDWERQKRIIDHSLQTCKRALEGLPDTLKVLPKDTKDGRFGQRKQPYYPPMPEYMSARDRSLLHLDEEATAEGRRAQQFEIEKANIYASHLSTRSYLVEKYFTYLENSRQPKRQHYSPGVLASGFDNLLPQPTGEYDSMEQDMAQERENVIKDLLLVLGSIDLVNMEPNADSFTQKIRQIASTLLDVPEGRKGSIALQHEEYLYKFLDVLGSLERVRPETVDPNQVVDDETELRHWADLRQYQLKFQEQGGIYGFS